ncbi:MULTISPECIES: Bug family tripartite tricarboxylate transporter substrate binding protein [Achromobacter]|uniref:Extra-cytoplasmic solute receptor family protein 184 n=1 Tax=Achromobacter xylosoxidans (strain A8) TaxID=762376 RepID=E3HXY2_ACHXA|nr:tripartite tricarboxylate transporter substrate binding protein [Achromobacter xylosoxidans]ADP19936.1 extra-cytoplasmic solute receptor family protein 184 [Achromobacter xylosoxidans A8]
MNRWLHTAASLFLGALCLLPLGARAQAFPDRPVRLVVPFPPGGTTDILARMLGNALGTEWKQPVVIENKPGASGTIFSEQLARAPADGYTLMVTATHHVINPALYKNLRYDSKKDFTPVAQVAAVPNVLVINPDFAARNHINSVADLIAYAKANPGKVNFGSAGTGGANHLSGELFKSMTGVSMVHIPYKGAAPALNDLLGGQIPIMFDSVPGVLQHIKAGKLRALAVTSLTRSAALPDVPTLDEAGVKGFEATAWFGLYAPGNMDPKLLAKLSGDVLAALRSPSIQGQFAQQGAMPGTMTQPEYARFVNAEMDKWAKVINDAQITIQ